MSFTITILVTNTGAAEGLAVEHGLSVHIAGGGGTILFDTGASGVFLDNAEKLGIDLGRVDTLVFSHGHYDHAGGARAFFRRFPIPTTVLAGKNFSEKQYAREADGRLRYIGNTTDERWFMRKGIPFFLIDSPKYQLAGDMWLCTAFARTNDFEPEYPGAADELALVLRTERGLVAVCGCSHVGAVNLCSALAERFGEPLFGFIGGLHLKSASEERVRRTAEWFAGSGIRLMGACHCSGEAVERRLRGCIGEYRDIGSGSVVTL